MTQNKYTYQKKVSRRNPIICVKSPAELNAESLDLYVELPHVDDLVPDERLQEDTHQAHQPVLHVSEEGRKVSEGDFFAF